LAKKIFHQLTVTELAAKQFQYELLLHFSHYLLSINSVSWCFCASNKFSYCKLQHCVKPSAISVQQ